MPQRVKNVNDDRAIGIIALAIRLVALPAAAPAAALPQVVSYPQVSPNVVVADNTTSYTVTVSVSDADGYSDIVDIRVLLDYTEAGGDASMCRGYLAWATTNNNITRYGGTWVLAASGGFGRWGYCTDLGGGVNYITPVSCSASTSGTASGGMGSVTPKQSTTISVVTRRTPSALWTPF